MVPSKTQWPTWSPMKVLLLQTDETTDAATSQDNPAQTATPQEYGIHCIINTSHYSRLNKLLTITVYILRFCANLKHPEDRLSGPITAKELSQSRMAWIRNCQALTYGNEITNIQSKSRKRTVLVRQLQLFLDNNSFLRYGGRIHNAPINEVTKFPYLLPANHHFTMLMVRATHERLCHAGVNSTVTALRQSYWIPAIRQYVKKILRKCVTCNKLIGKPYKVPDPPPLPKLRVEQPNPFYVTGVDFTGALYVREKEDEHKVFSRARQPGLCISR